MKQDKLPAEDPPVPYFVLRGHTSAIQCLYFHEGSLLSGDAHGYAILWSLETCRPLAIWRAHRDALLTISCYNNRILTHGRDNKLYVWEILDIEHMSISLPLSTAEARVLKTGQGDPCTRTKPFLHGSLDVNALNFCRFASSPSIHRGPASSLPASEARLIALPGLRGSEVIDVFELPSMHRLVTQIKPTSPTASNPTIPTSTPIKGLHKGAGTVMALDLRYPYLAAGYESGLIVLFILEVAHVDPTTQRQDGRWAEVYRWQTHRDAVLGVQLRIEKKGVTIFSSGIDARIGQMHVSYSRLAQCRRHLQTSQAAPPTDAKIVEITDEEDLDDDGTSILIKETKHAGQQSLTLRNDGKLLATADWQGRGRIYHVPLADDDLRQPQQVAVLKWHRDGAVQAIAFAKKEEGGEKGRVALGGKDGKISLWELF